MNRFIKKCIFLGILFSILFSAYNWYIYQKIEWDKLNHFELTEGDNFDIAMFNSSRGINIAEDLGKHHKLKVLGVGGGGVLLQQAYLEYFSLKNNSADHFLYFIEPLVFCNSRWEIPENGKAQKFDLDFLSIIAKKFGLNWAIKYIRHYSHILENKTLYEEDVAIHYNRTIEAPPKQIEIEKQRQKTYRFCGMEKDMKQQRDYLYNTVSFINENYPDSKLIFIYLPTLLNEEPYKEELFNFLEQMNEEFDASYYDFSDKISLHNYYHDFDHLNIEGATFFNKNYLFPIIGDK